MAFGYFFPASANRLIHRANQSDIAKYIPEDVHKQFRDLTNQVGNTVNSAISSDDSKSNKA
jgi:hypothetical protein